MKIDKRFEIPFICSAGAVPWSKVWKEWRRATEVKPCSIPCLSLSTPAEEIKEVSSLLDFLYLGKPCPKSKFLFPFLASSWSMASGRSLGWLIVSVCSRNARAERIQKIIYIFNIRPWWHQCNIICATFLLSHCSAEDRFRQAEFLQVLIHQSDISMALQRLLGQFQGIWGDSCRKFLPYQAPRNLNIYP